MASTTAESVRDEVAELLGVSPAELDPQADLIASGLDSIRMMSLSGRWRRQGIDVGFAALAANPTLAAWSELVTDRAAPATEVVAPVPDNTHSDPISSDEDDAFPLAPIQHALWVGRNDDQQLGGVAAHLYIELDGNGVDPARLTVAAAKLAARHPMLRVQILPDGTQRISDRELPVTVYDLRDLELGVAEERLEEIRHEKSHQIMHGEVLQISLSQLPDGRTRLHVDLDMQAADAVSYRNFMSDLAEFYGGADLPDLGYTYRQYREAFTATSAETDEDRQWWAERIPDLPEGPALPLVPRSDQADPQRGVRRWHIFDVSTRDALFAAAQKRGITPAMAVAASYAGTLARWSTNRRFLLNLPMFGREQFHPDVDKLVGDFTSSLMLDVDLTGADTPIARARVLQTTLHATARHASYSGLSVLRDLTRHHGTPILAPIVYTSALGLGDLFAGKVTEYFGTPVWTISQGPQVLLDAQATPVAEGLMINWDTREDAFRPGVADAMFAYHLAELERLAADESAWDAVDLPAVTREQQATRDAANAVTDAPSGDALHDGFFRRADAQPDAPAVFSGDGDLTYGELRERVLAVAAALDVAGVRRADAVAVMGPKNFEQIIALLAISAIGAVYVPVGVDHPADRAARMLTNGGVRMALVCGDEPPTTMPALTVQEAIRVGSRASGFAPPTVEPAELGYILFTSGSTGEPKGVEMSHDAAMNTVEFINGHFEIGRSDRCLALSTLECDLSVLDIFGMLRAGGSIVVVDEEHRRDPDAWARLIERHGVTVLHFMPGWLEMLAEVDGDLSSVRVVPTGGDWVRPELVRALRKRAPHMRFAGLGGATETATHNTVCEVGDIPEDWSSIPLGVPVPNNACRVVGADGHDCPDWVPGELWVGGRGLARGYCARPDLTAERFVEHDGKIWYRTGDLVRYRTGGIIEFVGRADHRIKISGYRVELGDVEAALRGLPGVDSAVAAAVSTEGGRDVLAALVSGAAGAAAPEPAKIAAALSEVVAPHMIPQIIVTADQVPYTLGGKLDRAAVAAVLKDANVVSGAGYRAPATPLEAALSSIIGSVLGRQQIGADDDFFAIGGDSVLATQVVARLRTWLDIPGAAVADIFATRTVSALAARLTAGDAQSGRLSEVAELFLEVSGMDSAEVVSALETTP